MGKREKEDTEWSTGAASCRGAKRRKESRSKSSGARNVCRAFSSCRVKWACLPVIASEHLHHDLHAALRRQERTRWYCSRR
jgi:hypothetical protein